MGKPYSDDLRDQMVSAMASGQTCREAGEAFAVAPSTAGDWYRRYQATNSYAARPMGGDRRSKLTDEAGWIADRLDQACGLTLVEVRCRYPKQRATPTIDRAIRREIRASLDLCQIWPARFTKLFLSLRGHFGSLDGPCHTA